MSVRRRLALVVVGLPIALYGYACSSSDSGGGGDTDAGTQPGSDGSVQPGEDSSMPGDDGSMPLTDSSTPDAADASDGAVPIVCIGNPLYPDGGTPDGGASVDAGILTLYAGPGGGFLDGPQWVSAGAGSGAGGFLVFSEFSPTPSLHRMAADGGALATFRTAGLNGDVAPIGNAVRGNFILTTGSATTNAGTPVILQTAFDGGPGPSIPLTPSTPTGANNAALSPNDLAVGKNGSIYITDPRYQTTPVSGLDPKGIFQTGPDAGGVTRIAMFAGENPNGIALSPDGSLLYISFTTPGRVDSYPVSVTTGVVTPTATPVITAANLVDAPDGLAVDIGGNIWVAESNSDGVTTNGRIEVFTKDGKRWGQIPFPGQRPTGVAFGGPGNKTLFVTAETGVFAYVGRCAGIQ